MEVIANIVVLIFSLNIEGLILLLISFLAVLFAVICLFSFIKKQSIAEHFDNYAIQYIAILLVMLPIILFMILYKISFVLFAISLALIPIVLNIIAQLNQPTYGYDGIENNNSFIRKLLGQREARIKRRVSLTKAKSFVKPYKKLMGSHTLSNQFCQLIYIPDNIPRFTCLSKKRDKGAEHLYFTAFIDKNIDWNNDFFNSICLNFSYNTNFENLYSLFAKSSFEFTNSNCQKLAAKLPKEKENDSVKLTDKAKAKQKEILAEIEKEKQKEILSKFRNGEQQKINVNDATEADLTALPGINIVQAKKIIKYRNLNSDFASVDDFIAYTKVKPHFEALIRERTDAQPTIIKLNAKKNKKAERIIDLD